MRIIKGGQLPIKEWRGTCHNCGADVIWEQSEGVWGDDQRDGEYCHISCPTEGCKSKIYGAKTRRTAECPLSSGVPTGVQGLSEPGQNEGESA